MGKKRTNDTNAVEKLVEESTPTKKIKKSEDLVNNDPVKEVVELKKTRGRAKRQLEHIEKPEIDQEIEEKPVENIKEDRRGRSKKTIETKSNKQTFSKKKKVDQEIEQRKSEKEEEESDKEEKELNKEEQEDERIAVFDSEEESKQPELNKSNTSLKKFDFKEFAGTKETTESNSEEDNKVTSELEKEVETKSKRNRSKKASGNHTEQPQTSNSPVKPATKNTKKTSTAKKSDQQTNLKASPKATKTRKTSTTKKAKETEIEEEEENNSDELPVELVEDKPARQTRKTKNNQSEQESNSKIVKATKGKKSKLAEKVIEEEDLSDKEESEQESNSKIAKETEIEEENNSDELPVDSVEDKPTRQTRKTKNNHSEQESNSKIAKVKANKGKKSKLAEKVIEEEEDLSDKEESEDPKKYNKVNIEPKPSTSSTIDSKKMSKKSNENPFKIISLNCAGIRAAVKKGLLKFLNDENADIVCLQETKCTEEKMPEELKELDYFTYWNSSESKPNHSGVATLCKVKPIKVTYGIGSEIHDNEGRAITCEYDNFYLVNIYATNASRHLTNLDKKRDWNEVFKNYLIDLDKIKPVIACGDFNCAHKEIDLKNPKNNHKTAGFTPEERRDFSDLLENGFFDSFRELYPDRKDAYTFWSNMARNARANNIGWRLDYYILSNRLQDALVDNIINEDQELSDHCPITLLINV